MTKRIWTGVFTAIVGFATAAITAQTTSPPQSNPSSADRRITVTGCLKEAPSSSASTTATGAAGTTGTAGTTGATGAAGTTGTTGDTAAVAPKFLLTNASSSPADPSGSTSATGVTAAAAASASAGQTYRLIANVASLSPHVGKKLELIGTLEDQDGAARTTEPSAGSEANALVLRVESGKIVAASCSQ
jgi:hypothetical protein